MENQLKELRQKLSNLAHNAYNKGQISELEFHYYLYFLEDKTRTVFYYQDAIEKLEAKLKQTGFTIDLSEKDKRQIIINYIDPFTDEIIVFNAAPLIHNLFIENTTQEAAQAIDQAMEFMIGFLGYAGWKMDSSLDAVYKSLRRVQNGIIAGYSDCDLKGFI